MRSEAIPHVLSKGMGSLLCVLLGTYLGTLLGGTTIWSLIDGTLSTVILAWMLNTLYGVLCLFLLSKVKRKRI